MIGFTTTKQKKRLPESLPAVSVCQTVYARWDFPAEVESTLAETVSLQAEGISPFDEGTYAVGFEVVERGSEKLSVLAAVASNDALAEQWHGWFVEQNVIGVCRLDLSILGWVRILREKFPRFASGQSLVILRSPKEWLVFSMREGCLATLRATPPEATSADVARETMLMLAQMAFSETGEGALPVLCLVPEEVDVAPFQAIFGASLQVERVASEEAEALLERGLALREEEGATFDLTPSAWHEEARARKRKKAVLIGGAVAVALWLIVALVLIALPQVYAKRSANVVAQLNAHHREYLDVLELRRRVAMIERYQDRQYSALEMLRLLCTAKAPSMTFLSVNYRQKQNLRVSGLSDDTADVYALKEKLQADPRVHEVKISRLTQDPKTRRQRFDVELVFPTEEEGAL